MNPILGPEPAVPTSIDSHFLYWKVTGNFIASVPPECDNWISEIILGHASINLTPYVGLSEISTAVH